MAGGTRAEFMKTVREIIRVAPGRVDPDLTTQAAVILLKGYDLGAIPVLEGDKFVGMIQSSQPLAGQNKEFVSGAMVNAARHLTPDMSAREAASIFVASG